MELELAEVTETVTGAFAQGTLVNVGPPQALLTGTQQGVGGAMNSLAIGNAGGLAQTASIMAKAAPAQAATAGVVLKHSSLWSGINQLGIGKWGLSFAAVAPYLLIGTLIAVGVGVYGFLQYRNQGSELLPELSDGS